MASTEDVPPAPDTAEPNEAGATTTGIAATNASQSTSETAKENPQTSASLPNNEPGEDTRAQDKTASTQKNAELTGDNNNTTTASVTVTTSNKPSESKTGSEPEAVAVTEGETSDQSQAVKEGNDGGPELVITLLLTTGARHPFKIDGKYLRRQSVNVDNDDPFNMSVYTLKELIWREWRSEWEPRPTSPSSIRLISFGKLLDDKSPLSESSLTHDAPNVIHMTVKPQEVVDEEDTKGGKSYSGRDRDTTERSPGCRCIIL